MWDEPPFEPLDANGTGRGILSWSTGHTSARIVTLPHGGIGFVGPGNFPSSGAASAHRSFMFLRNLLAVTCLLGVTPVFAAPMACPTSDQRAHFTAFRDRIAGAKTPEKAREMALAQTHLGHLAIRQAARSFPHNEEIEQAENKLNVFEDGVRSSISQQQVARQFDLLVGTQALSGGCSYGTVEIVVIVIGFIFGIIPGIIFLFLFC